MVQVLPYVPNFLDRLGPVLQEAGGQIGQVGQKQKTEKNDATVLQQMMSQADLTPIQLTTLVSKLSPEKQQAVAPIVSAIAKEKQKSIEATNQLNSFRQGGGFAGQFNGEMPQQPTNDQSIRPSTSTPPSQNGQFKKEDLIYASALPGPIGQLAKAQLHQMEVNDTQSLNREKFDYEKGAPEREFEQKALEKELLPFYEEIAQDVKTLPASLQANQQMTDAIIRGDIGPGSFAHIGQIARDLGVPQSITKLLESPDSKEFNNGAKQLMGHTLNHLFKGTTTQREIALAEAMQAEVGVNPNSNLAAAWAVQSDLLYRQERIRLVNEYSERGQPRSKIPKLVEKKLEPYRKQLSDQYFQAISELRKKK